LIPPISMERLVNKGSTLGGLLPAKDPSAYGLLWGGFPLGNQNGSKISGGLWNKTIQITHMMYIKK
jgi:hypothetical protein